MRFLCVVCCCFLAVLVINSSSLCVYCVYIHAEHIKMLSSGKEYMEIPESTTD